MTPVPFLAFQVRASTLDGLPHVSIRAVTVVELFPKTQTARIDVGRGLTYAPFSELRRDRREAGLLAAEKLIASPAAGESAVAEMAGRATEVRRGVPPPKGLRAPAAA